MSASPLVWACAVATKDPPERRLAAAIALARMRMGEPVPDRIFVSPATAAETTPLPGFALVPTLGLHRNVFQFPRGEGGAG